MNDSLGMLWQGVDFTLRNGSRSRGGTPGGLLLARMLCDVARDGFCQETPDKPRRLILGFRGAR